MKKLHLLFVMLLFVVVANAQTESGNFLIMIGSELDLAILSEDFEYDGTEMQKYDIKEFEVSPSVGYFIMDKLAVGAMFSYEMVDEHEQGQEDVDPSTLTSGGVFGRFYFMSKGFAPYAQAMVGYASTIKYGAEELTFTGFVYGGAVGATYFVNEHVGVEMGVNYITGSLTNKADEKLVAKYGDLGVEVGLVFSF